MAAVVFGIVTLVGLCLFSEWLRARRARAIGEEKVERLPAKAAAADQKHRTQPWYMCGIMAAFWAAFYFSYGEFTPFKVILLGLMVCVTMWEFYKQRPQFSIRDLLLTTLLVAAACGMSHYVSPPLVIFSVWLCLHVWFQYRNGTLDQPPVEAPPQ